MDAGHLIAFNVTLLAALISPGPALLFALRQTVRGGFQSGLSTGIGLALMAATWTGLALVGLTALLAVAPWLYLTMKIVGAVYLLWIAYHMWRDAIRPLPQMQGASMRSFVGGVLVNLANPKSVLFAGSVLVVIFPPDLSLTDKGIIALNQFLVECAAYGMFAALLSTRRARDSYLRLKPTLDRVAAGVLGLLGLRLLASR